MAYPDAVTVGGNLRNIGVIGDPVTAAAMVNMVQAQLTDAQNLDASLYAMLVGQVALLLNSSGTFDRARSNVPEELSSSATCPTSMAYNDASRFCASVSCAWTMLTIAAAVTGSPITPILRRFPPTVTASG